MRRVLICAAIVAAGLAAPLALRTPLAQTAPAAVASGTTARVIVKFRETSPLLKKQILSASSRQSQQAAALGQRIGLALEAGRGLTDRSHVVIGHGLTSKQLAARIAAEADVEFAFADERKHLVEVPNDPLYASATVGTTSGGPAVGQWYLKPPGAAGDVNNTAPAAINAQQAWDVTKGSTSIVVAVLDTGVRFDHPDLPQLTGNMLPGYDMVSPDSSGVFTTANDGNGRDADASDPGDFVTAGGSDEQLPAIEQLVARHADARPHRRGDQQRPRHGERRPRRRQSDAGARARQVRRLRLGHPGRHAVGGGHRRTWRVRRIRRRRACST